MYPTIQPLVLNHQGKYINLHKSITKETTKNTKTCTCSLYTKVESKQKEEAQLPAVVDTLICSPFLSQNPKHPNLM